MKIVGLDVCKNTVFCVRNCLKMQIFDDNSRSIREGYNRKVPEKGNEGIRCFFGNKSYKYFAITSFFFYFATDIKI